MDIEELVLKHLYKNWFGQNYTLYSYIDAVFRAALTELAQGYEQKIAGLESEAILSRALSERIRQLDARLGGYLTVGGGHIVHGTAEALARVQAYILLDSKHPVEARDTNRYFAKQLQTAEQRIRQLEAERVPEGWIPVSERLPDSGVSFLAVTDCAGDIHISTMRLPVLIAKNEKQSGDFIRERVTHWMPLPEAPQQKKEGE